MEKNSNSLPEWIDPNGSTVPAYIRKAESTAKLSDADGEDEMYKVEVNGTNDSAGETTPLITSKEPNQESNESALDNEALFREIIDEAEKIEVRKNKDGKLITEDGSLSHLQDELYWKIARTPSFKKWFQGSIVCHENGEPKVVYRASLTKDFSSVNGIRFPSNAQKWQKNHIGVFFTSHKDLAVNWYKDMYESLSSISTEVTEEFLNKNESTVKIFPAFIRLRNPFIEDGYFSGGGATIDDFTTRRTEGGEEFMKTLQDNHDGLYIPVSSDYGDEYAVINDKDIFILPNTI